MMSKGDPYDAGKDLHEFYKPVQREDKVESTEGPDGEKVSFSFATRFWQDGSPGFTGICAPAASGRATGERTGPPWLFQGYLSI